MSTTKTEFTKLIYNCQKVFQRVTITYQHKILLGRSGLEMDRATGMCDCSNQEQCPTVATHHGMGISYDWTKCAFKNK